MWERLYWAAWVLWMLFPSGCQRSEAPQAAAPVRETAPGALEDPPYAPDSVFMPDVHRAGPILPPGAMRAGLRVFAADASPFSYFGHSSSLDGDTAVVGAPYEDGVSMDTGSAYVFQRRGERWVQSAKLTAPLPQAYDRFGFSVAVHGRTVVVGADRRDEGERVDSGAAFVFRPRGSGWVLEATLVPRDAGDKEGLGVAVAAHGNLVLVGAPGAGGSVEGAGAAYLFQRSAAGWREEARLAAPSPTANSNFGAAVALAAETALVGAWSSSDPQVMGGAAYVFRRGGPGGPGDPGNSGWRFEARLAPPELQPLEKLGAAVALGDGLALVGAPRAAVDGKSRAGAVYLFRRSATGWSPAGRLTGEPPRSDEEFGRVVSLADGHLAVGSQFGDAAGLNTGVAYLFDHRDGESGEGRGDGWVRRGPVLAVDAVPVAEFATSLSLSDRWMIIGAPRQDDKGNAAGCAYLYELTAPATPERAP